VAWISLHTVMQRRHMIHFEESRSRAGVLGVDQPLVLGAGEMQLADIKSRATACSSQSFERTQV